MWHIKTRQGTFWIVEDKGKEAKFYLGCEQDCLAHYSSLDKAVQDVSLQQTGHLPWDEQTNVHMPENIEMWEDGAPESWSTS